MDYAEQTAHVLLSLTVFYLWITTTWCFPKKTTLVSKIILHALGLFHADSKLSWQPPTLTTFLIPFALIRQSQCRYSQETWGAREDKNMQKRSPIKAGTSCLVLRRGSTKMLCRFSLEKENCCHCKEGLTRITVEKNRKSKPGSRLRSED